MRPPSRDVAGSATLGASGTVRACLGQEAPVKSRAPRFDRTRSPLASASKGFVISQQRLTPSSFKFKKTVSRCFGRCLFYSAGFTLPFVRFPIKGRFNSVCHAVVSPPDSGPLRYRSQISFVTL